MTEHNGQIHKQVAELLSAYMDGEVTASERALVDAHLVTCSICTHDLETLYYTLNLLRQIPQAVAPRPFTLRESDIEPVRPARRAWWRLPWAQGLAAAAAMLLCVVVVGGVVLMSRRGMVGGVAQPESVAMQAPPATAAPAEEPVAAEAVEAVEIEKEGEAEKVVVEAEAEKEMAMGKALDTPASTPPVLAAEEAAPVEPEMVQEAPAEAAPVESRAGADQAEVLPTTTPPQPAAAAAPMVSATPAPAATPTPAATPAPAIEATAAVTPTTFLEVADLALEIEPGVIHVNGRLPLPEGRKLLAELWREGQLTDWGMPENQPVLVGANGQFSLGLQAKPEAPDFDLFAIPPANYQIRIRPVDPPERVEARIPFETFGPPPGPPTNAP